MKGCSKCLAQAGTNESAAMAKPKHKRRYKGKSNPHNRFKREVRRLTKREHNLRKDG